MLGVPSAVKRCKDRVVFCLYKGDSTSLLALRSCLVCLPRRSLENRRFSPLTTWKFKHHARLNTYFPTSLSTCRELCREPSSLADAIWLSVVTGSALHLHIAFVLKETIIVTYSALPASRPSVFPRLAHDTLTLQAHSRLVRHRRRHSLRTRSNL